MLKMFSIFFGLILSIGALTSFFIGTYSESKSTLNTNFYTKIISDINSKKRTSTISNVGGQNYMQVNADIYFNKNKTSNLTIYLPIIIVSGATLTDKITNGDIVYNALNYTNLYFNIKSGYSSISFGKNYKNGVEYPLYMYLGKLYLMCNNTDDCNNPNNFYIR